MKLEHLSPAAQKTRAKNLYERRGFNIGQSDHPLLEATALAIAIQKELVAASIFPDYRNAGRQIVETNWGDVLVWIADAKKDDDDRAVLNSIVLTSEQKALLDDFADILTPVSKGVTKTSVSKFTKRYQSAAEKREEAAARKAAKEKGEEYDGGEESEVSKGVSIVVCDLCDEFCYVPNGFSAKKCSITRGCEGTLVKPPKCEREWTTAKREAARKRAEKDAQAEVPEED